MYAPVAGVRSWRGVVAVLLGVVACAACAPLSSQRQTDIMAKTGKVSVSGEVLRLRVNDLVDREAGRIEQTADRIIADSTDAAIRRRALVVKVDVIPALYAAGFRADPLAAAMDVWGFAFQFQQYVENGEGRRAFGPEQPQMLACARDVIADVDTVIRSIAIRPEHFDAARTILQNWAASHPVEQTFLARASGAAVVANLRSDERDVFVTIGAVSDLIEDLSERLNAYAAHLPKQARWQAEILLTETMSTPIVGDALGTLRDVGATARRAQALMDEVPDLLEAEREMLAGERGAILSDINTQRLQTLQFLTAERFAVIAAARDERVAVVAAVRLEREALVAALRQERLETLVEVDKMLDKATTRAMTSTLDSARDLIDYTIRRMAILSIGLMLAAAAIAALAYRLAVGRRPDVRL
jgi:hypothetical protein